jgi:hypothetical protein
MEHFTLKQALNSVRWNIIAEDSRSALQCLELWVVPHCAHPVQYFAAHATLKWAAKTLDLKLADLAIETILAKEKVEAS